MIKYPYLVSGLVNNAQIEMNICDSSNILKLINTITIVVEFYVKDNSSTAFL